MTDSGLMENVTFDELHIGRSAEMTRTLTLPDIQAFAVVSGDHNPAHLDADYAQASIFGGVIAHGMWEGALVSSVLGTAFPGPGTIYLDQTLHFSRPVRVGDTLTIRLTVTERDEAKKRVTLDCAVTNQRGEVTLTGVARVLAPTQKISRPRPTLPRLALVDPQARLQAWIKGLALTGEPARCAVVHPVDADAITGAVHAAEQGVIAPIFIGPLARMQGAAREAGVDLSRWAVEDVPYSHAAAARAAEAAAAGEVQVLMKGSLHTDELMHAVLAQPALRTGRRMSHVFRFDIPSYAKPLLVTDAALHVQPTLDDKVDIIANAVTVARVLGVQRPKVAILAAVETVSAGMPATLDAAALCKMADRGQIKGALVDGPLAFDNAISPHAARIKGITSPVAGDADVLVVPDLEAGNVLAKQLEYFAGAAGCGVVAGARVPIALTSRADSAATRSASAALAVLLARAQG
ncbi:MAG: bifunctional enoyl-CoA hydratase/phosphate acetyltransferase [Pseudomonadota bacterium]